MTERTDMIEFLTGRSSDRVRPRGIGMAGEGEKFLTDGRLQTWAGNTFLCHIPPGPQHDVMRAIQEELKMSRFNRFYTFLPPASFHMTLFQGISPTPEGFEELPKGATLGMDRDAVTEVMHSQIANLRLPKVLKLRAKDLFAGQGLHLEGCDVEAEASLRQARVHLREATGITHAPNFDEYRFHITFAYLLEWVTEPVAQEIAAFCEMLMQRYGPDLDEITLGPVEFCTFDTMHHFEPLQLL